jgi:hypothetical protein
VLAGVRFEPFVAYEAGLSWSIRVSQKRSMKVDGPSTMEEQVRRPVDHVTIGQ